MPKLIIYMNAYLPAIIQNKKETCDRQSKTKDSLFLSI
jgi:hypothetical protein